jgi:hypothetical protein
MRNSNIVVAVMCLEKAGDLLQYFYPDVSRTLLSLSEKIKEENGVASEDLDEADELKAEIENG